jgi:fatty acid desaturase
MTVPDDREMDAVLAAMLAPPERPGDRGFANEVERLIDAQAAYARARRRFWRSFAFEVLAVGALLAALWLLSSTSLLAPLAGPTHWGLAPPLLLILLLWFGTQRWRQA